MSTCRDVHVGPGCNIGYIAACLAPPEAQAAIFCAQQKRGGALYALGVAIDLIFLAASPLWWELRRDAWAANFGLHRVNLSPGEPDVYVYFLTPVWVSDLVIILDGGSSIPADCCTIVHFP